MLRAYVGSGVLLSVALLALAVDAQEAVQSPPAVRASKVAAQDVSKWTVGQQQFHLSAQRAQDWLKRTNKPDGRFVYGFLPALCVPLDGDDYVAQAGATFALARASRYFRDDAGIAIARQTLLTLLLETTPDARSPQLRHTAASPAHLDRLAAHGALLLAIHELPQPGKDLLDQGEQLASYLREQQQPDGAFQGVSDVGEVRREASGDSFAAIGAAARTKARWAAVEGHQEAAGLALSGVVRSHAHRPAPWKLDATRKARDYYMARWQRHKNLPLAVSHTPAYADAFFATKEPAFSEAVYALNDWLCELQYSQVEPRRKAWTGGFPAWENGQALLSAPNIRTAACAESLAQACRVARATGDLARYQRYGQALEQALHFVVGLQYTPAGTRHFVEEFRPALVGGFYASQQDGTLRVDYTQASLAALVTYLEFLAE